MALIILLIIGLLLLTMLVMAVVLRGEMALSAEQILGNLTLFVIALITGFVGYLMGLENPPDWAAAVVVTSGPVLTVLKLWGDKLTKPAQPAERPMPSLQQLKRANDDLLKKAASDAAIILRRVSVERKRRLNASGGQIVEDTQP